MVGGLLSVWTSVVGVVCLVASASYLMSCLSQGSLDGLLCLLCLLRSGSGG